MCGIAGLWRPDGGPVDPSEVVTLLSAMPHRGPEGAAVARLDGGALALGFLALGFTDTPGSFQPLYDEGHELALLCNGEIYDHEELRNELIARGHRFRTRSDAEVVLHLYQEEGERCLERLNGEFALALWDARARRLLCARDRFGIKPLHVARHRLRGGGVAFVFASEAKALLALPGFERRLDPSFFLGPGVGLPDTARSPFAGIRSVRAGHLLTVDASGERERAWWVPRFLGGGPATLDESAEALRTTLRRAVRRRVGGDVPIALALSSGLDSTIVAALAAEVRPELRAFTVAWPDRPYDEAAAAALTARHLGLAHQPVPCTVSDLAEGFLDGVYATEIPTNNLSTTARLAMARAVRASGAKALTGGEAADEILGGYPTFGLEAIWRDLARGERGARSALRAFEAEEHRSRGVFWDGGRDWRRTPPWLGHPSTVHLRAVRSERLVPRLLSRAARAELAGRTPLEALGAELDAARLRTLHPFDAARVVSRSLFGTFVVTALGDRVEMAASLEGRVPFLDADVVDLAYSLPQEHCVEPGTYTRKRVLRRAFADRLPPGFRAPPKHTWMAPTFRELAATPTGRALVEDLLSDRAVREAGLLSRRTVRAALAAWRLWPGQGARFPQVDGVVGYLLSVQALHEVHVRVPRRPTRLPTWVDRTPADA